MEPRLGMSAQNLVLESTQNWEECIPWTVSDVLRELLSDVPELVGGEGEVPEEDLLAEELLTEAGQLVPRQPDLLQLTVPGYTQANG